MKKLNFITKKEESDYMRDMKTINTAKSLSNVNENWMADKLDDSWSRQVIHGYRIFDFWNAGLGIAIEVDGPEHDREYDNYRDEYNFRRSGIIVLRVRNKNEDDANEILRVISQSESRAERRHFLGIYGSKKQKRVLSDMPYDPDKLMFVDFLQKQYQHSPYWMQYS